MPDDKQELKLGLNSAALVVKVLSALKSLNKLCEVLIVFRSFKDSKFEARKVNISMIKPQVAHHLFTVTPSASSQLHPTPLHRLTVASTAFSKLPPQWAPMPFYCW